MPQFTSQAPVLALCLPEGCFASVYLTDPCLVLGSGLARPRPWRGWAPASRFGRSARTPRLAKALFSAQIPRARRPDETKPVVWLVKTRPEASGNVGAISKRAYSAERRPQPTRFLHRSAAAGPVPAPRRRLAVLATTHALPCPSSAGGLRGRAPGSGAA